MTCLKLKQKQKFIRRWKDKKQEKCEKMYINENQIYKFNYLIKD